MIARADKSARTQIRNLCVRVLIDIVNLNEARTGCHRLASQHGGVGTRRERGEDDRFGIARWRQTSSTDLRLLGVSPVVVRRDQGGGVVMQFECWIGQRRSDPKSRKGGSKSADEHGFVLRSGDNEAAD